MTDQGKDKPATGKRIRLSGYLKPELVDEVQEIIEGLPFRVTLSGFVESAIRHEIDRVKAEGLYKPKKK